MSTGWSDAPQTWNVAEEAMKREPHKRDEPTAYIPAGPTTTAASTAPAMTIPEQAVEAAAKKIYELLPYNETSPLIKPPWIPRGNSFKQDEARRYAIAALEAASLMGVQRPEDVARAIAPVIAGLDLRNIERARVAADAAAQAVCALPHTGQPQEGELQPHDYVPSTLHMGDCALCGNLQRSSIHSPPPPVAESGWQPTPSQITDAVWEVLATWRPGMSDEVKHTLGVKIAERFARKTDAAPPHIAEQETK